MRLLWKQSCPENFHCIEYSFCIQDFWASCACPETQSVPWIHCIEYIFFIIQNFEQPALALKNRICPRIFHCIEIFFIVQDIWASCACPEKQTVHWIHRIECIFYPSEFWTTCACPEKQSLPWKCSLDWNQDFWVTCACSENRVFPEIFHCIEYRFYIQDFWATCACREKQSVPWIHCIECICFIIQNPLYWMCIFYHSEFWTTCACPEKPNLPWKFLLYWNIFYLSEFLSNLSLPSKQSLHWIFQAGGAAAPPAPRLVRHCSRLTSLSGQTGDFCSTLLCIFLFSETLGFSQVQNFLAELANVIST